MEEEKEGEACCSLYHCYSEEEGGVEGGGDGECDDFSRT